MSDGRYEAVAFDKDGDVIGEGHSSTPQRAAINCLWDLLENRKDHAPLWDMQIRPEGYDETNEDPA